MILTDNIITLRPFNIGDAEKHLAGEDEQQIKWLSGGKSTLEGIKNWIKGNQKHWKNNGPIFNFAIFDDEYRLVGMIEASTNYQILDGLEKGDANISYGLYPSYRGKGYAKRSIMLILDFIKSKGLQRAIIRVNPENINSLKVAEHCEFIKDRIITTKNGEELVLFIKSLV